MNENLLKILEELGIEEKPAKVYLATLELGGDGAAAISKRSGVERVNTYYILEQLAKEGLLYSAEKEKKTIFVAISPKKLEVLAQARLERIRQVLPELVAIENSGPTKPKIRYFEGIEGIKQMFEETLDLPKESETLAYSSFQTDNKYIEEYIAGYIPRRVHKKISQRCIIELSEESKELIKRDKEELRESAMVDKDKFPFSNQINIFGNKMFIASYRDMMGVIIESAEVTRTQRSIFELAWLGAKSLVINA
jgi:sugar-specific transcriptional regulator TrmB